MHWEGIHRGKRKNEDGGKEKKGKDKKQRGNQ
jgi:hypothetical protein